MCRLTRIVAIVLIGNVMGLHAAQADSRIKEIVDRIRERVVRAGNGD
jgi:hypothetical protein